MLLILRPKIHPIFLIFVKIEKNLFYFDQLMKNFLLIAIFFLALFSFACGSKNDNSQNSNRAASNQSTMDMNTMNPNVSNQNAANTNANASTPTPTPVNPDAMLHNDMESAPNAANAPYDLQFIDTMIAHHQAAIVMAKPAVEKASHPELKNMAQNIVRSQTKEIEQMQQWREQWFKNQPPAVNMNAAGMADSMKAMDMQKLGSATGNNFDIAFIEMMIPHHQGALSMAKEALEKAQHAELKTLAQSVIMGQETEVDQMQQWQKDWSKQ